MSNHASLSTVHKEIAKKCPDTDHTEISPRGQFTLEPHPHWSSLGVKFEFSDKQPRHFYIRVSPGPLYTSFNRKESEKGTVFFFLGGGGGILGSPSRQPLATLPWVGRGGGGNGPCEERKNDKIKTI